jgi:hypothetical protein
VKCKCTLAAEIGALLKKAEVKIPVAELIRKVGTSELIDRCPMRAILTRNLENGGRMH